MDGAQALSDLTEVSSQIEAAIVLDADGQTLASTVQEQQRPEFAQAVQELLAAVRRASGNEQGGEVAQAEIATGDGSVFLVRDEERTIAATTGPEPTVGLVFYDLKSCLRNFAGEPKPKPRPRARKPKKDEADAAS
jgi:predicted regulator of Ras-like GTPase activity (Roadblock/LC7/MglB family)